MATTVKLSDFHKDYDTEEFEIWDEVTSKWVEYKDSCYYPKASTGFPDIEKAEHPLTLITMCHRNQFYSLGLFDYDTSDPLVEGLNIDYVKCKDEKELLKKFIILWEKLSIDIVTGWYVEGFDIPYLTARISKILGDEWTKRLSPWGLLQKKQIEVHGDDKTIVVPMGISVLDYLPVYKKFGFTQQESYKLDHVAKEEIGRSKVDHEEGLLDLEVNHPQKYVSYNIVDVDLVVGLDKKRNLINLAIMMAYDAGANFQDTFGTVVLWDSLIHNYLMDRNIVIEPFEHTNPTRKIAGGFVKEPQVGLHGWTVSFDLTSLYPSLIMMYNISPEKLLGKFPEPFTKEDILNGFFKDPKRREYLENLNATVCANGMMYSKDGEGFLPAIMRELFDKRAINKNKMNEYKRLKESGSDLANIDDLISQYDSSQSSAKTLANGGYGACANEYFRWFMLDMAESITLSGQLAVQWIEQEFNTLLNQYFKTDGVDYVIYVDTDSNYLNVELFADKCPKDMQMVDWLDKICKEALTPFIDKKFRELTDMVMAPKFTLIMKREAIASRSLFIEKKKYVLNVLNNEGVAYKEPKIKVTGLESVRTSTPAVCRKAIQETFRIIMNEDDTSMRKYVESFREDFMKMPFEAVAFPRGVSDMDKWKFKDGYLKGTPIHVRAAINHNKLVKEKKLTTKIEMINNGGKIKFSYMKTPNPIGENVIAAEGKLPVEFGLDKYIDRDLQFEKTYLMPIRSVTNHIGWQLEQRASLEDWFS